ncbi:hypothetical protein DSECCO2_626610 [anaerobic digester metagenome]
MRFAIPLIACLFSAYQVVATDTTRVLFIGNSITYYNDMPQTFEDIANSLGDTTEMTMYAPGGTGFVNHVSDPAVFNYFRMGCWDYIVLQPGSNESPGYSYPIDTTLLRARILLDSIYRYNPCAQVLYYEISYGVWGNSASDLTTYNNTMDLIVGNLTYLADSTRTFFAPAGEAFRTAWNNNQNDMLWMAYGDIHPNAKGSYMAACTFYSAIFQKPSHGTPVLSTLTAAAADSVQLLCDSIVLNHLADWRINVYDQITDFSWTVQSDTVFFTNLSANTDSLIWYFGDDMFSYQQNPVHEYSYSGTFTVELVTWSHGCQQIHTEVIDVTVSGTDASDNELAGIDVWPNPASDYIYIGTDKNCLCEILDESGKTVLLQTGNSICVSELTAGWYLVRVSSDGEFLLTRKILIE